MGIPGSQSGPRMHLPVRRVTSAFVICLGLALLARGTAPAVAGTTTVGHRYHVHHYSCLAIYSQRPLPHAGPLDGVPFGIAIGPLGNVYVLGDKRNGTGYIAKYSPSGTLLWQWAWHSAVGSAGAALGGPRGIAIDAAGTIYIADTADRCVAKFTPRSRHSEWHLSIPLRQPDAVAVGPHGNIYVVDRATSAVEKFTPTGQHINTWRLTAASGAPGASPTANAQGVAVDADGSLYVAVTRGTTGSIVKLSQSGRFVAEWSKEGRARGEFGGMDGPGGVAVDAAGNVYVTDTGNRRVQKLSPQGEPLAAWGTEGYCVGQFSIPWGIAVDRAGNSYVTDLDQQTVQKFSPTGQARASWGGNVDRSGCP